jgi:hypothetical protein
MSEIQNRNQKIQEASDRSARIRECREEIFIRGPLPKIIASRTIVVAGRMIHQHLMDFGRELGRGKCRWMPDLQSFGVQE